MVNTLKVKVFKNALENDIDKVINNYINYIAVIEVNKETLFENKIIMKELIDAKRENDLNKMHFWINLWKKQMELRGKNGL